MKTDRVDTRTWDTVRDGVLVVDKPAGWTSHDVVGKVRYLAKNRKVGHAGTLDPMATGVLVLGIGKGTRLLKYIVDAPKEYRATLRLGIATVSEDAEGEQLQAPGFDEVSMAEVAGAARKFVGTIMQIPSAVSAIKIDGKRAYDLVRQGKQVELSAREVTISAIEVETVAAATSDDGVAVTDVTMLVRCSAGTYIRALGRDIAAELGTVGHLIALRRTAIGRFMADEAREIADVEDVTRSGGRLPAVPLAEALRAVMAVRDVTQAEVDELRYGRPLAASGTDEPVAAVSPMGDAVAVLVDSRLRGEILARPTVVLV